MTSNSLVSKYSDFARKDIKQYGVTNTESAMQRHFTIVSALKDDVLYNSVFPTIYKMEASKVKEEEEKKSDIPNLCLASYNITANFYTDPQNDNSVRNQFPQHHWINRKMHFATVVREVKPDAMALQELSPEQAIDLMNMLPEYKLCVFVQAPSADVEAGKIYCSKNEIWLHLIGKSNIGIALIGILYNPEKLQLIHSGMFWYNPKPFIVPTATDRSETDKGFGNRNTPRGPGYIRFLHIETNKQFYLFTSHAPLSGGWQTRQSCFAKERQVIAEIVRDVPWFSVGDRNMFPDPGTNVCYETLLRGKKVYDWKHPTNHVGHDTTWLGYSYYQKEFQNQIRDDGSSFVHDTCLDIGIGSVRPMWSAHYHCIIRDEKCELVGKLIASKDNETRNFLSDHSMVVAKFLLL